MPTLTNDNPTPSVGIARAARNPDDGSRRVDIVDRLDPADDFNFRHFRMRHMVAELIRTWRRAGIAPGDEAPPFELEATDGSLVRLDDLRGRPVLVHFVSYTCPVTRGGAQLMRNLHAAYGDGIQFVEILVRQAHPGRRRGRYTSMDQKRDDARCYRLEERIDWPVLVDDLDGTTQHAYGGLSASAYLIDETGRVVWYAMWGPTPSMTSVVDDLLTRGSSVGPAHARVDRVPHLGAAIVSGQGGPARGGLRSFVDLELGFPGAALLMTIGRITRPLLQPHLQRVRRRPPSPRHPTVSVDPETRRNRRISHPMAG